MNNCRMIALRSVKDGNFFCAIQRTPAPFPGADAGQPSFRRFDAKTICCACVALALPVQSLFSGLLASDETSMSAGSASATRL